MGDVVFLLSFGLCHLEFEAKPLWAVLSFCFSFFGQQRKGREGPDVEGEGDYVSSLLNTGVSVTPSIHDSEHYRSECEK